MYSCRLTRITAVWLVSLLLYQPGVYADDNTQVLDLPLDKLVNMEVQSASKFMQKASEAPSAVEVWTAENIRQYGWRTLADALNAMRGLYVHSNRDYSLLGVRGFTHSGDYNSRVLVMIDGRRMNETIFDTGAIGEEFLLDMNLIERIEYIHGSGSSVYGANALLGVVNIITKSGKAFNGLNLTGEVGSYDTYRGRATYGKKWDNGVDLLVNASRYFSHGQDKLYFPEFSSINGGIAEDMDIERTSRAFGKLSYGGLTLRGGYVDRYKRVPTAAFQAMFNNKNFFTVDRQGYVDLDYVTQINPKLGFEARGYHHWYDYHAVTPFHGYQIDQTLSSEEVHFFEGADSRWWGGELKLISTQFDHQKWVAGIEVQHDQRQHFNSYLIQPNISYDNVKNNGWRAGAYVQDEYRVTNNLLINAGLRLDYHHFLNSLQVNPRIGLIWDITPTLTTKLLYSSAFRAPNVLEHDLTVGKKPTEEQIKSYEALVEWYAGSGVKFLGTVFFNQFHHVIELDTLTLGSVNSGKDESFGFEFSGEKFWENGRMLKLSWSHNSTRDKNLGQNVWLVDSPKNMVKLHYSEPLFRNRLSLGFEEIFIDQRRTNAGHIAPGYHLFNINIATPNPLYGFKASLGIYNVLNQHYEAVAAPEGAPLDTFAMDGRTARFRLEYGF